MIIERFQLNKIFNVNQSLIDKRILRLFLVSCTLPGYTSDPTLGCYRIVKVSTGTKLHARQICAKDGGRILLVNSAYEASAVLSILSVLLDIFLFLLRPKFSKP